jgi:Spy/CpxP family protein refolding chaperone
MKRMRRAVLSLTMLCVASLTAAAQEAPKPHAGEEGREVKSLSAEEVESLLKGEGAGMAKAAELNHYPGPRHVIELADRLKLTAPQRAEAQRIFDAMRAEAVRLGARVVEAERALDRMFARGEADSGALARVSREIGVLRADLRAAHLRAHIEMRAALTREQIRLYDELRGYGAPGGHKPGQQHGHGAN